MRQAKGVAKSSTGAKRGLPHSPSGTGQHLVGMCSTAALWLERNAAAIDALNVFPVPDGDTGTNMLLTLRAAVAEARSAHARSAEEAALALAHGALMGARGNSGVILSQFLQGFAQSLRGRAAASSQELAGALAAGSAAAYQAVSKPVEGTILTVARAAAAAAQETARRGESLAETFTAAAAEAARAVERTPEQLKTLRDAGVVDAGGQGFRVFLEGAAAYLREGRVRHAQAIVQAPAHSAIASAVHGDGFGFCTELVILGQGLALEELRRHLSKLGTSVMVVGDPAAARVHVHTREPQAVVDYASQLGQVDRVKIEDMDAQHREARDRAPAPGLSVVAVAWGEGFARTLESLGARPVVRCGQTMNPSVSELLAAVERSPASDVVLLPNNPNVLPAARQVASLTAKTVTVLPTESLPQGVAALLAYNTEAPRDTNLSAMNEARQGVRTLELTRSTRAARVNGRTVRAGETIALLDSRLIAAAGSDEEALRQALIQAGTSDVSLVTVYYGQERSEAEAQALARRLGAKTNLEWETVWGGQPYHQYILSLE